jgi:hypothetical protein
MNKLAAIRTALTPHAAVIAEAVNSAQTEMPTDTIKAGRAYIARAVTNWLLGHRDILDAVIAAFDGLPVETVAARNIFFIGLRLSRIDEAELATQGIGLGDLYDMIMGFASPPPQGAGNVNWTSVNAYRRS